jgi:hypothetical protein
MKTIDIKWNDTIHTVTVDDDSYSLIARHTWYIMYSGPHKKPYAFAELYSKGEGGKRIKRMFYMHQMVTGSWTQIDHINGDSLDNRFENLRVASYQENGWNRSHNANSLSGYKGVAKYTTAKGETLYRVTIKTTVKGAKPEQFIRKTGFKTDIDAAKWYNEEVIKLRGKWAWLNPIPGETHNATKGSE